MTLHLGLKKLGSDVLLSLGRHLLGGLIGFIGFIYLARMLGTEANGQFHLFVMVPGLLVTAMNLGLGQSNAYFLASKKVTLTRALSTNKQFWFWLSLVGLIIAYPLLHRYGATWLPGVPRVYLWVGLAIFPINFAHQLLVSMLQGKQDFRSYNAVLLAQPILQLVLFLTLLGFAGWDLPGAACSVVLTQATIMVLTYILLRRHLKHCEDENASLLDGRTYAGQSFSYGWKSHLSNVITFLNYRLDIFLVNFFLQTSSAGIYVVAVSLAEKVWILSRVISLVLFPRLAELSSNEEVRKVLTPLIARWVFYSGLVVCLLLGLLARPLVGFLFGEDYLGAVVAIWYLLPGVVLLAMLRVMANDLAARGKPQLNLYSSLMALVVNLSGNLWLIPRYGIIGAALATTLSYTCLAVLVVWMYTRESGNVWWRVFIFESRDAELCRKAYDSLKTLKIRITHGSRDQ